MSDLTNWLKGSGDYKNSYAYQTITKHYNEADGKSIALRLLIHFMGDIHQPLHCLTRLDKEFPQGDKGGNSFPLKSHDGVDELHALWDTLIYLNHNSYSLPFTSSTWTSFGTETNNIAGKFSFSSTQTNNINFYSIAQESFKIGSSGVYKNINMNDVVSQSYIDTNLPIAEQQMVLGGLRLAHLMTTIFPNTAMEVEGDVEQIQVEDIAEVSEDKQESLFLA